MSARRAYAKVATLAALAAACRGAPSNAVRPQSAPVEAVTVRVENRYRADVTVLVLRGSVRTRLGTIVTAGSAMFRLPATYVGDASGFYLIADPVGGTAVRSDRVIVHGGERITWSLESDLARSSLAIY